jgi:hypothetical protein
VHQKELLMVDQMVVQWAVQTVVQKDVQKVVPSAEMMVDLSAD